MATPLAASDAVDVYTMFSPFSTFPAVAVQEAPAAGVVAEGTAVSTSIERVAVGPNAARLSLARALPLHPPTPWLHRLRVTAAVFVAEEPEHASLVVEGVPALVMVYSHKLSCCPLSAALESE